MDTGQCQRFKPPPASRASPCATGYPERTVVPRLPPLSTGRPGRLV